MYLFNKTFYCSSDYVPLSSLVVLCFIYLKVWSFTTKKEHIFHVFENIMTGKYMNSSCYLMRYMELYITHMILGSQLKEIIMIELGRSFIG